jgi:hypothetical protein
MVLHMKTTCRLFKEYITGIVSQGSRTSFFPIINLSPRPLIQDRRYIRGGKFPQIFTTGILYHDSAVSLTPLIQWRPRSHFYKICKTPIVSKGTIKPNQARVNFITHLSNKSGKNECGTEGIFFLPSGVLENDESISNSNILVNSKSSGCKTGAQNRDNWWRKKNIAKNFVRLSL